MTQDDLITQLAQIITEFNAFTTTMNFIVSPQPKYKFSRDWYVAEFNVKDFTDVVHWCREQFGPHPRHPDAWSRWKHTYENKIHFRDEQDYMWFLLRWS